METNNLYHANLFASDYDKTVVSAKWIGPALIYDLIKKDIYPGAALIDLGIGSGESSRLFKNKGVTITGLDGSEEMLKICAGKNLADKLVLFDLHNSPLPFKDSIFDFAISHALFHLLTRVEHLIAEVSRILKPYGLFVFTIDEALNKPGYKKISEGLWERRTATNVLTYRHELIYIKSLLEKNNFIILDKTTYLAFTNQELKEDFYFTAILAQKTI